MQKLNEPDNSLLNLIRSCEHYDLSEKQSLDLINSKLSKPISRSTYYNYKKKLYQDEKFQSLKKSIYNSKLLKCLMLYLDDDTDPRGLEINKIILEQFPNRKSVFEITEEQQDKIKRNHKRIQSNFSVRDYYSNDTSNLTRVNQLPKNYTIREEYVRCGKEETKKCKSSRHGPYYYAYWREKLVGSHNNKLRKKYLGTIDPRL